MTRDFEMHATLDGEEGPVEVHVDGDMITVKTVLGIVPLHLSEFDRIVEELAAFRRAKEAAETSTINTDAPQSTSG